jgi:purine-binding chemotaxis protein CheW
MTSGTVANNDTNGAPGSEQVLTFVLGGETYGVDILRVQEIRGWSTVTKIPHAPRNVLGVLNLRGSIVPIVDMRMQFNLERAEYTAVTVIIVLSVQSRTGHRNFGVVVDGVSDVVTLNPAQVQPAPDLGSRAATEHIRGLIPVAEQMVVLLDIDRLIGGHLQGTLLQQQEPIQSAFAHERMADSQSKIEADCHD